MPFCFPKPLFYATFVKNLQEVMTDEIAPILIDWYEHRRRELPWRATRDPYLIWISEVILQQTRVAQGLEYFYRFTERFPDVRTLAEAPPDDVLRQWQGLGYYSRARNLHAAAQDVMMRFGGIFPSTYDGIRSLKGVGEYTAAAIASFAFGLPHATVDGNVFRWLARLYDLDRPIDSTAGKKQFTELAESLIDRRRPGLFNQAAMEFGALQCTPKSPDCPTCPFSDRCLALAAGTVADRPVKQGKTEVKPRWFNYLIIRCGDEILLGQRTAKDIWQHLYEYPLIETTGVVDFSELQSGEVFRRLFDGAERIRLRRRDVMPGHVLSHRVIHAVFYVFEVDGFTPVMREGYRVVREEDLDRYAVSRLIENHRQSVSQGNIFA
jgi:A/G-specific adenine glycosylase